MKTETVKLSQVQENEANPRTITNEKFQKLVNSVLALPKMLELRPIVVDNMMVALGGNMRFRALTAISDLSEDELKSRLFLSQFNAREVIAEISCHKAEDAIARKTVKGFAVLLTEPTADDFSHNRVKN
jgi:hypothetical protein